MRKKSSIPTSRAPQTPTTFGLSSARWSTTSCRATWTNTTWLKTVQRFLFFSGFRWYCIGSVRLASRRAPLRFCLLHAAVELFNPKAGNGEVTGLVVKWLYYWCVSHVLAALFESGCLRLLWSVTWQLECCLGGGVCHSMHWILWSALCSSLNAHGWITKGGKGVYQWPQKPQRTCNVLALCFGQYVEVNAD